MEQSNILMQGYIDLYNPYKLTMQNVVRKFQGYSFPSDFTVQLSNVHFIDDNDEYIELNTQMLADPSNRIHFKKKTHHKENDVVICYGLFAVNIPYKYLTLFTEINTPHNGFDYDIYLMDNLNEEILTNDCIEINYPYKLTFNELKIIE